MQERHVINASYYCERANSHGLVRISNNGAYVVAEYSENTSLLKWHRVVPAEQRNFIERWLGQHFPAGNPKQKFLAARA